MKMQTLNRKQGGRGEQGSIMIMSAVGMLSFLLAVGLGVDISHLYLAKNELQNAADAAALAGASGLNSASTGITIAANRACQCGPGGQPMNSYDFGSQGVTVPRANVRFAANLQDFSAGSDMSEASASSALVAPTIKFVKVTTAPSAVGVSFAAVVLGNTRNLSAVAVGGMSAPLNVFTGFLPVSGIDPPLGQTDYFVPGNLYTIRGGPQNSVSPGNYQVLAVDGSGASDDRIGLASGVRTPLGPGDYTDTKPGVSSGAVRQGVNTRFDDYGSQLDPDNYPPDTNIKEGITYQEYLSGSPSESPSHPGVDNRRVVLIPIIKQDQFDGGRTNVQIDRFGAFFLRSKVSGGNGGDIEVEYIGIGVVVGSGGYDPTGTANGGPAITKPVLYQ